MFLTCALILLKPFVRAHQNDCRADTDHNVIHDPCSITRLLNKLLNPRYFISPFISKSREAVMPLESLM